MKLTVSMATYDDYDGVYFTVQALRLYQGAHDVEILVLDNNPHSLHGVALQKFAASVPEMRVMPVADRKSSFVKYDVFKHATGDIVLGLDSHVLLYPGFLDTLMAYWQAHPESRDLLTGPLVYDGLQRCSTHQDPCWRGHDYGCWAEDREALKAGVPFEVPMQGMGCFSYRREAWQGILSDFVGYGAEEWYIAEKVRSWGGRVLCHPELRWVHRFNWPRRTFPLTLPGKILNYYRGWLELYGSLEHPQMQAMKAHWLTLMPEEKLNKLIASVHPSL